jgi:prepilin-type N-terminal cleavage/methylation domain-containing protein
MTTNVLTLKPNVDGTKVHRRGIRFHSQSGFSLPEVVIVVLIGLIVTTIAMPSLANVVAVARVRGNISTLSGIFQNCRMMAVKNNRTMTTRFDVASNGIMAYVKLASDSAGPLRTDTQVELEAPITRHTDPTSVGGPAAMTSTNLGFTPQTGDASFNSRGLPCAYSSGTCTNSGFAYYFKVLKKGSDASWAAVTISPAGRIRKWFWDGASWAD